MPRGPEVPEEEQPAERSNAGIIRLGKGVTRYKEMMLTLLSACFIHP